MADNTMTAAAVQLFFWQGNSRERSNPNRTSPLQFSHTCIHAVIFCLCVLFKNFLSFNLRFIQSFSLIHSFLFVPGISYPHIFSDSSPQPVFDPKQPSIFFLLAVFADRLRSFCLEFSQPCTLSLLVTEHRAQGNLEPESKEKKKENKDHFWRLKTKRKLLLGRLKREQD